MIELTVRIESVGGNISIKTASDMTLSKMRHAKTEELMAAAIVFRQLSEANRLSCGERVVQPCPFERIAEHIANEVKARS